jgi:hypothetical protein
VLSQRKLFQIVGTLHASRRFAGSLNGWQQKTNQYADDRNDHQ